jgi:hypothetical protein
VRGVRPALDVQMGPVAFLICISDEVNAPFDGSKIGVGAVTGCEGGEVTFPIVVHLAERIFIVQS